MRLRPLVASTFALTIACGTPDAGPDTEGTGDDSGAASSSSSSTSSGAASTGEALTTSGGSTGEPEPVMPTMLPTATGTCPTLAAGDITFAPAGIEPRDVHVWMSDAAATMDGPFVFYWHGTGSNPQEAVYGLGKDYIDQVVAQGGIIVAPYHDPAAGDFPWWLVVGDREDDLLLADEILACAIDQVGVDVRRIHVSGMSAGGLQTSQMSFRRSGYVASAAPYSGGIIVDPPDQDASNPLAAMIFHGGKNDIVVLSFKDTSERYEQAIEKRGGFAFICDHGLGHTIPQDAQASVWKFFYDHPFGTRPSSYKDGLPTGFPAYCAL
jgi:poly(3-hydroxybutyrate) depolymerase